MQQQTRPTVIPLPAPAGPNWPRVFRAAGLTVEQGDAAAAVLDTLHGGREGWAAGCPENVLTLQVKAQWALNDPAPLPHPDLDQIEALGNTLLTVVNAGSYARPHVRRWWTQTLTAAIRRAAQHAAVERGES